MGKRPPATPQYKDGFGLRVITVEGFGTQGFELRLRSRDLLEGLFLTLRVQGPKYH